MQDKKVDVGAVIDSANYFWVPFSVTIMMIIIMLTDGYDLFMMGYIGPHLIHDWGITRQDLGPVNSAGLIGMAIGSIVLGWLGDRIGRKRAYMASQFLLFVGALFCYRAGNVTDLTIWRGIMGLGLGGVTPLATALASEWTPAKARSIAVACVVVSVPVGGALAGVVEQNVVAQYGWRSMFLIGAIVPLVLFAVFSYFLPESPKYMAQHPALRGKLAKALNRLIGERRFDGTESFAVQERGKRSSHWFSTIWNSDYRRSTAFLWLAFSVNSFLVYLFVNYLRILLESAGQPSDIGSRGLALFNLGAAFGSIGGAFFIGWFGSRWVGSAVAFLGAVAAAGLAMTLLGETVPVLQLLMLCLLAGASMHSMQAFLYAVSAHSYPTDIRASAVGMAQTFSRIGAVLSPAAASFYFAMPSMPPVSTFLLFLAGCALVTTLSFFLIPSHIPASARHHTGGRELQVEALKK